MAATDIEEKQTAIASGTDVAGEAAWAAFARTFLAVFSCVLALGAAFVFVTNPYGNLPGPQWGHIAQGNQRYQYPAIARSGRYDSVLIGTSTSGILKPTDLDSALGGRFANLAMDNARAWEQLQIASLFHRVNGAASTLIVGVDTVWCDADADEKRITERGFPAWMYDDDPINDLSAMLNWTAIETGFKGLRAAFGAGEDKIAPDGYKAFLPDERLYDLEKARQKIGPYAREAMFATPPADVQSQAAPKLPALAWLDDLISLKWKRAALVFMPVHIAAQPPPGTPRFTREQACKRIITKLGQRMGVPVIDFRFASELTATDSNFWDRLHYRVPVGKALVRSVARALKTGTDDLGGHWKVLAHPGPGSGW